MLIIEVGFAPVNSKNGFFGIKDTNIAGTDKFDTCSARPATLPCAANSLSPATNPSADKSNKYTIAIPIAAAIAVVTSKTDSTLKLILPSEPACFRRVIADKIEINTNGITIICNKRT